MDFLFKSHIGMVRKNNEDYCKGEIIEVGDGSEIGIFAIADGMGGHNKGEVASQLAVENLIEFFNDNLIQNGVVKIDYIEDIINNLVQDEKMMQGITRLRNYIQEKLQTKDIWQG